MRIHARPARKTLLSALAIGMAMTACGGEADDAGSGATATTPPVAEESPVDAGAPEPQPEPEETVVFAGPGGAFGESFRAAFEPFEEEHGISVEYIEGLVAENFSRVQTQHSAGNVEIDVVVVSPRDAPIGKAQGIFAPLDSSLVTNLDNLADFARDPDDVGAAFAFSPDGIIYNRDVFEANGWEPPTSWSALWDPMYADCVIPIHPSTSSTYVGMLNYVASGGDYSDFEATLEKFEPIADQITAVANSPVDAQDFVAQEVGCLSSSSQGRALSLGEDSPVEFVLPEEGASVGVISVELVDGAPHPTAGQLLINEILSAETQRAVLESAHWSPTNREVTAPDSGVASQLAMADDFESEGFHIVPPEAYDELDSWIRRWDQVVGSAS